MTLLYRNIRQKIGDMTLQRKIILMLVAMISVPLLAIIILFFGNLRDMVISNTIRKEQDLSAQTAPHITATVQTVLDSYQEILDLPFMAHLFKMPVNSLSELATSEEAAAFPDQIENILSSDLLTGFQIYIDFPDNDKTLFPDIGIGSYISPLLPAKGTYWYGIFQGSKVSELHCPSFYLGSHEKIIYGDMAYIRATTVYYQGQAYPAYIALYYSATSFQDILIRNLTLDGSVSYILNERNALIATTDESLSGIYRLDYKTIQDSFMSSNNFIEKDILDTKVYAGFYNILQPGWFLVTVLPSPPLIQRSNMILFEFLAICILFLFVSFLASSYLARSVTNRLSSVIAQMHDIRKGIPKPMESPEFHDEVGDLIDTYNYMARKMDQMMTEQKKADEDLRIAEFTSLQAQINPHFLYNTMDMINWLAKQGRTDEVSTAVQNLSRFYKLTLSRKQSISTIEQEEEHASIYIYLQNMRFHDHISFIVDLPEELMDYQIPKLTFQPIIENAIFHGILETEEKKGTILLTGWLEDDDLVLMISDDGVGIPAEKLKTILSGTGISTGKGTNIAIYNTHRRFQILYGENYGLSYNSSPGNGTEVQIRLPAKK